MLHLSFFFDTQVWDGFMAAVTSTTQMVYVRINVQLFVSLYTSRGRWSLVDDLLITAPAKTHAVHGGIVNSTIAKYHGDMASVTQIVRELAAGLLGSELSGN
jgi:hypothetical protein